MNSKDTFCSLPFVHICNHTGGYFTPCCKSSLRIKDEDGTLMQTYRGDTFQKAFYSSDMIQLRDNLLNGIQDPSCSACWDSEKKGVVSKRHYDGSRFNEEAKRRISQDGRLPFQPLSWDLKIGMFCNLKCRTCEEETSSSILLENLQIGLIDSKMSLLIVALMDLTSSTLTFATLPPGSIFVGI